MVAILLERRLTSRQTHLRDALVDLVLAQGFSHLTMDDFAAQIELLKRTLYALAASKEQIAVLAVRQFFKRATEQVEAAIARTRAPANRGHPLSRGCCRGTAPSQPCLQRRSWPTFVRLTEIYEQNTLTAARRVRELIDERHQSRRIPAGARRFCERGRDCHDAAHHRAARSLQPLASATLKPIRSSPSWSLPRSAADMPHAEPPNRISCPDGATISTPSVRISFRRPRV